MITFCSESLERNDLLNLRDRSLVTIVSLIIQGITDSSLTYHLQSAKKNGITRTETSEIFTHIAFYAGWPKAWAAFRLAKDVWAKDTTGKEAKAAFQREMIFPIGVSNTAYAQYFIAWAFDHACAGRTVGRAVLKRQRVTHHCTLLLQRTGLFLLSRKALFHTYRRRGLLCNETTFLLTIYVRHRRIEDKYHQVKYVIGMY